MGETKKEKTEPMRFQTPEMLKRKEKDILKIWMEKQLANTTLRLDLINQKNLEIQSRQFLTVFIKVISEGNLKNIETLEYKPIVEMLENISKSRAKQGFDRSEVATYIFSLQDSILQFLQKEYLDQPNILNQEVTLLSKLIIKLGLVTIEASVLFQEKIVEERTQELREDQEQLAYNEKLALLDQLARKEKLAILGKLAGGVGHELRNPLGAIKNAAYFLKMVLENPEPEVKETLEILEKEITSSEHIISSLLDFARSKPPARSKVAVNDLLQEVISQTIIPDRIKVVSKLDESRPKVLADPDQLGQVFKNLMLNAFQAMPKKGQLVIKSEILPQELVAISFADSGTGITKENQEKIFEPLFTTKAKGIGLGLAIVKTLIEGHGGTIEVQSEPGKGSIFTVKLSIKEKKEVS